MNELKTFMYHSVKVRTIELNGEPWFVLKDVCEVLGISKYRDVTARLDADERATARLDTLVKAELSGASIEIPITASNTYTQCAACGAPIQLSLDFVAERFSKAPMEYKSLTDYFSYGFICERCAENDDEEE